MAARGLAKPWPAMSGAEPWMGSYRPGLPGSPSAAEGKKADAARQHGRLVRQDVAEQVVGDDHIELARVLDQLHGGVVGQHVLQLYVGVVAGVQSGDHFTPQKSRSP